MNLQEAHDLMDLLLDKADQPYFTEDEKNMFLDQAIASFINNHYQLYEQEQVSRDALASFLHYEAMNNTDTDWVAGVIPLPSDYVHIIQVSLAYNTTNFSEGKQAKIIGLKDFYERTYSSDPFNKATEEHPVAYVRKSGGGTSLYVGYFPQIPAINNTATNPGKWRFNCLVFKGHEHCFATNQDDSLKEIYQREVIDIAIRKMTGNIEGANVEFQQIEAEQSKSI